MSAPHRRYDGFSLLEVIVAITLLGVTLSAIFSGMSGSLRTLGRVEDMEQRLNFARLKLAELDLMDSIRPNDRATGTLEDGTQWTIESFPFVEPILEGPTRNANSVIRVQLTLEWPTTTGTQTRVIETYRYAPATSLPIRPLEEQLREIQ